MKAANDTRGYGWVARFFHWGTALLIFAAIALGLYADSLSATPPEQIQRVFQAFSIHKTLGITVLVFAVMRLIWTLTQPKPRPLHPKAKLQTWLGEMVHLGLTIGMIVIPLSGWLLHSAAPGGFARILWPFGQRLPGVPQDLTLSERFGTFHDLGWWVLGALIALHVAGVLKHVLIDKDATLARMAGPSADLPEPPAQDHRLAISAVVAAGLIWAALAGFAAFSPLPSEAEAIAAPELATPDTSAQSSAQDAAHAPPSDTQANTQSGAQSGTPAAKAPATLAANGWTVESGNLSISVTQAGSAVTGSFGAWQAQINYDPTSQTGQVAVDIDIASLTLGAVSENAKGPDFLNAAEFPKAHFTGQIDPAPAGGSAHVAKGELTIAGKTVPADLAFDLTIQGDTATAKGGLHVDRRDFDLGKNYTDESTVAFGVDIAFDLIAKQQ